MKHYSPTRTVSHFERFSTEEINLMCIYDTSTLNTLRADLAIVLNDVYEPEMVVLINTTLEKLNGLTQEDFDDIGFYAAEDEEAATFDFEGMDVVLPA